MGGVELTYRHVRNPRHSVEVFHSAGVLKRYEICPKTDEPGDHRLTARIPTRDALLALHPGEEDTIRLFRPNVLMS